MRPPTIAELAMAARIFPENLQACVAIMRGRNELEEFQHLPGCDGLPFCGCIEAAIRRRYPDELASLTGDPICGALNGWVKELTGVSDGCRRLSHGRIRRLARGQSFTAKSRVTVRKTDRTGAALLTHRRGVPHTRHEAT